MQLDFPITQTRILTPKRRNDYLSRPRLVAALKELIEKKLILVAAPAGYGKTALLVEFAESQPYPFTWYAIDPLDQDPVRFISYLIATIQTKFPSFGQNSIEALKAGVHETLDLNYMVTVLVNDIYDHIDEHFVIVLDDYHLVNDCEEVNYFISNFIQDVDENCHIVVASRTLLSTPDLPLLVARLEVGGISYEELAFSNEEVQELFEEKYNHPLSETEVLELNKQTEGWITGILLSSIPTQTSQGLVTVPRRVSGYGLNEYFLQLLKQNSEEVQNFILRSSLLQEFDAQRCQAIIGGALGLEGLAWRELMQKTLRQNLFVLPVGEDGRWLRYHHLFSEFLQTTMRVQFPAEAEKILLKLAEYLEAEGELEKAYAINKEYLPREDLIPFLSRTGPMLTVAGRPDILKTWLTEIPDKMLEQHPSLVSLQGNVATLEGDLKLGIELYNQALAAFQLPVELEYYVRTLSRRSTALRLVGNLEDAIKDASEILERVSNNLSFRGLQADAYRTIGISSYQLGKPSEALTSLLQASELYKSIQDLRNEAIVKSEIGIMYQTLGEIEKAMLCYDDSLAYWREQKISSWQAQMHTNLGVLYHMRGQFEEAVSILDKAVQHSKLSRSSRSEAYSLASLGDIYRDLDAYAEARGIYTQTLELANRIEERYLQLYIKIALGTVDGLEGKYAQAQDRLNEAKKEAKAIKAESQVNAALYELAILDLRQGAYENAAKKLQNCLAFYNEAEYDTLASQAHYALIFIAAQKKDFQPFVEEASKFEYGLLTASLVWLASQFPLSPAALEQLGEGAAPIKDLTARATQFSNKVPEYRKRIRQKSILVPFAAAKLHIRTLGKLQIKLNGRLVSNAAWQTQYARDLFLMLLANPEGLTKEAIGLEFWPDASMEDVKFRFKNTVYRLRRAIGKDAVQLNDDYYVFNDDLDYEYDVERFTAYANTGLKAKDPEEKIAKLKLALKWYRGKYLPDVFGDWVDVQRDQLHQLFIQAGVQLSELLMKAKRLEEGLEVCERLMAEDETFEPVYRLAMQAYADLGDISKVVKLYERCQEVLDNQLGVAPSSITRELYHRLITQN